MREIRAGNGVVYTAFENLSAYENLVHGFSTRLGGVSSPPYDEMNLGFGRGDSRENVENNYRLLAEALKIKAEDMVLSSQVHLTRIREVGLDNRGEGIFMPRSDKDYDGMMTDIRGVFLVTFYADCVPLFFYDRKLEVTALSHAGWKGSLNNMTGKTIEALAGTYGSRPEDILMGIGPSIASCCYEVGEEVASRFEVLPREIIDGNINLKPALKDPSLIKSFLNLQDMNKRMAIRAGIPQENIEIAGICTSCNQEKFFSHRVHGDARGSLVALMGIRQD